MGNFEFGHLFKHIYSNPVLFFNKTASEVMNFNTVFHLKFFIYCIYSYHFLGFGIRRQPGMFYDQVGETMSLMHYLLNRKKGSIHYLELSWLENTLYRERMSKVLMTDANHMVFDQK